MASTAASPGQTQLHKISEVLPRQGLVYSEKSGLTELLCKPKIMPIKSMSLEKLEQMQKEATDRATAAKAQQLQQQQQLQQGSGPGPVGERPLTGRPSTTRNAQ
eukprot:m51a1_g6659 putative bbsome-interacting protein 1-like (104) ;mRNA; r:160723-161130